MDAMTTKEALQAELDNLSEEDLTVLLQVARGLADTHESPKSAQGLLSKLQEISIEAPEDFATNLDLYVSGAKRFNHGEDLR